MNDDEARFKNIAFETITEEIIQESKKDYTLIEKQIKTNLNIARVLIFGSLLVFPALGIIADTLVFLVPYIALSLIGLYFYIRFEKLKQELNNRKQESFERTADLFQEFSEISLNGKIISGTVSSEWSEIVVDKGVNVSKVMARFVYGEDFRIETKPVLAF